MSSDSVHSVEFGWVCCSNGNIPDNAVEGGNNGDQCPFLVVRGRLEGQNCLTPGRYCVQDKLAYIAWKGKEHSLPAYQILVATPGSVQWIDSSDGEELPNAVIGGQNPDGELYYIGRVSVSDSELYCGKILPRTKVCYYSKDGAEAKSSTYQILVYSE